MIINFKNTYMKAISYSNKQQIYHYLFIEWSEC